MGKETEPEEEFFKTILENRTISLDLEDCGSIGNMFRVAAARNTIEWRVGDWLTAKQVESILADERCIEVSLSKHVK